MRSPGGSATIPSAEEAAFVTVAAVDAVATVGDGDGGRGGAVSTGSTHSCSFVSSNVSESGDETAGSEVGVDVGCGTAVDCAGGGGGEDSDGLESAVFSS